MFMDVGSAALSVSCMLSEVIFGHYMRPGRNKNSWVLFGTVIHTFCRIFFFLYVFNQTAWAEWHASLCLRCSSLTYFFMIGVNSFLLEQIIFQKNKQFWHGCLSQRVSIPFITAGFVLVINIYEPSHDKTIKMVCAPSEDRSTWASAQSDQSLR